MANFEDATISILVNVGDGTFGAPNNLPVGAEPRAVVAVDLDGNDVADLAVLANDPDIGPAVQVLRNTALSPGDLVFEEPIAFSVGENADPNFVVSADFNDDEANDLVTVNDDDTATGGSVTVLLNDVPCPSDINLDEQTAIDDFLILLEHWGPCPVCDPVFCPWDVDRDCDVDINDFLDLLAAWGPCLLPP